MDPLNHDELELLTPPERLALIAQLSDSLDEDERLVSIRNRPHLPEPPEPDKVADLFRKPPKKDA